MKPINQFLALYFFFGLIALGYAQTTRNVHHVGMQKEPIQDKRLIVTTPIIYKAFRQKRPNRPLKNPTRKIANKTQNSSEKEMYIRVDDTHYFVKLCSSQVTHADIEAALTQSVLAKKKQRKTTPVLVTLDVTITEGNWDICEHDATIMQSRIGEYAIVHRIVPKSEVRDIAKDDKKTNPNGR